MGSRIRRMPVNETNVAITVLMLLVPVGVLGLVALFALDVRE
jgi:hypothetical protein